MIVATLFTHENIINILQSLKTLFMREMETLYFICISGKQMYSL